MSIAIVDTPSGSRQREFWGHGGVRHSASAENESPRSNTAAGLLDVGVKTIAATAKHGDLRPLRRHPASPRSRVLDIDRPANLAEVFLGQPPPMPVDRAALAFAVAVFGARHLARVYRLLRLWRDVFPLGQVPFARAGRIASTIAAGQRFDTTVSRSAGPSTPLFRGPLLRRKPWRDVLWTIPIEGLHPDDNSALDPRAVVCDF